MLLSEINWGFVRLKRNRILIMKKIFTVDLFIVCFLYRSFKVIPN